MVDTQSGQSKAMLSEIITDTDRSFYRYLVANGPSSRAGISAAVGISRPTASEAAKRLLSAGIIKKSGLQNSQRGPNSVLYNINAQRGHTLSLAMDHDWVGLRISDFARNILWEQIDALKPVMTRSSLIVKTRKLLKAATPHLVGEPLATTCSVADPVNPGNGEVISLPNSPFPAGHIRIAEQIFKRDKPDIQIDNDMNWAAFAESRIGLMQTQPNFLYVYIGAGIGAGLYINDAIYRGANGLAGEVGYAQIGRGTSLMARLIELGVASPDDSFIDVASLSMLFEHNPRSKRAAAILEVIAWVIANTAITINPGALVLAGSMMDIRPFYEQLCQAIHNNIPSPIKIYKSAFGSLAPLLGATLGAHERAENYLGLITT